jgi:Heparinase II/III-like protein/Heparinase II/III N-terminus
MQTLNWYYRRLRSMSAGEVIWRAQSLLRDTADRYRTSLKMFPSPEQALGRNGHSPVEPSFRVTDVPMGAWKNPEGQNEEGWWARLLEQADRITEHKLSFFDLENLQLGNPIDWNRDHSSGKAAPMQFAASIDYRDFAVTGDCKLVWEPNRHHHLVVLARAYRASGEMRYARAVVEQMQSWLDQYPFGIGMNWRSPLELGIRLINWVWAIDLIRDSGLFKGDFRRRVQHSVYLHMWEISRKYSRGTSANNHTIGEAAGVFIAASYFHELSNAPSWRAEAQAILEGEILGQTYPLGGTREQAFGYHLFVLKLLLISALVGRKARAEFSAAYWDRLHAMIAFVGTLCEAGAQPRFGDCDDAYVLDLGSTQGDVGEIMSIAAVVFRSPEFKTWAGGFHEPAYWLLGPSAQFVFDNLPTATENSAFVSKAFTDSGLYLLQSGERKSPDRISILFDCGELGFKNIAAHGHADALSFTLFALGEQVLVDPGTYDYFTYPEWRQYFRSTRAHNTVEIDGADQSQMLGSFLWNRHARAKLIEWRPLSTGGGRATGEHDGYMRLSDPVIHRRTLALESRERVLTVRDEIHAERAHSVAIYFHVAPECSVEQVDANHMAISTSNGMITMEFDSKLRLQTFRGSESPIAGWVSRGYHRKQPVVTIVGRAQTVGKSAFETNITIGRPSV